MSDAWKRCSTCKKDIPFGGKYYTCSVSSCNRGGKSWVFCSVACWDSHLPVARHRSDVAAIEETAPARRGAEEEGEAGRKRRKIIVGNRPGAGARARTVDVDVLVVASKIKAYIKDSADMNTSASAMDALTRHLVALCDEAVDTARTDGRKTVLDRDFPSPGRYYERLLRIGKP